MKIKFDSNQDFQLDAIRSIVDVFAGQPLVRTSLEWQPDAFGGELLTEMGIGNSLSLLDETILANVQKIQSQNGLESAQELQGPNFSVEMETGTGKTYVYLRTIFELNARYGWKKFIIVVPSVAIREGVLNAIELTREHFQSLYGNAPLDYWVYDSAQVSKLRQFSASNQMQLMVMNIQAFDKSSTIIQNTRDQMSGRKPIEFIRHARPVVVLDEPQNLATELRTKAIESLNPLCTLRYSATHKDYFNLVYRLDPVKAYDLRLVKRIEVDSVVDGGDFNQPYIAVKSITATKTRISAKVEIDVEGADTVKRKPVTLTKDSSLFELSNQRENYRGYEVDFIDAGNQYIQFTNGVSLATGATHGGRTDEVLKIQIKETIREHLEKELRISQLPEGQRMKVLSLFFVDRVAHYAEPDGKFRQWFVEFYNALSKLPRYAQVKPLPVENVHNGYFAEDKGKPKDSSEGRTTKADDEAYNTYHECNRLKACIHELHQVNHLYRDAISHRHFDLGSKGSWTDDKLVEQEINILNQVCLKISRIFQFLSNRKCFVGVYLIRQEAAHNKCSLHAASEFESARFRSPVQSFKLSPANTRFWQALDQKPCGLFYFHSPNLRKSPPDYNDETQHYLEHYKSCISVPIRYCPNREDAKPDDIGFLVVDTLARDRLNGGFHVHYLAAFADQMYNFLNIWRVKTSNNHKTDYGATSAKS